MAEPTATTTVFIAEDDPHGLELLEAYLADFPTAAAPCTVVTAVDGEEALKKLAAGPRPDVVILDVMMPKVSGFEVCKRLKADPATRTVPVLMATALHDKADIDKGVEAGADDFLTKPIGRADLLRRLRALLEVRGVADDLDRALAYTKAVEAAA